MPNGIDFTYASQKTAYYTVYNSSGMPWNTSGGTGAFESFVSGNWGNYALSAAEQGVTGFYAGTFPPAIPPGVYSAVARNQTGGSPAQSDQVVAGGDFQWNGTYETPLSDLATSGQLALIVPLKMYRGEAIPNFPFKLVSAVDHVSPITSGVVSGQIARDGGMFGPLQSGIITENGNGWYWCGLTSGDLLCNTAALTFYGVGVSGGASDPRDFGLVLQRSSGQP